MKWPWSRDSFIWLYANGASRVSVQISKSPSFPHPLILSPKRRTMLLAKEGGAKWWQLHWDFNTTKFFLRIVGKANSVGKSGKRLRWWRVQMVTKKTYFAGFVFGLLIDNWHPCFCISSLISGMNFPAAFLAIFSTTLPKPIHLIICKEKGCVCNLTESHHFDTSPFPNRPTSPTPRPRPTPHGRRPWHWNAPKRSEAEPKAEPDHHHSPSRSSLLKTV